MQEQWLPWGESESGVYILMLDEEKVSKKKRKSEGQAAAKC